MSREDSCRIFLTDQAYSHTKYDMRLSRIYTKTSKTVPADETSKNAQLLIKAGYVHKTMAGVYSFLPLGLRVLNNVENIVRRHMN